MASISLRLIFSLAWIKVVYVTIDFKHFASVGLATNCLGELAVALINQGDMERDVVAFS